MKIRWEKGYWEFGQLMYKISWSNNTKNGIEKTYNRDGTRRSEIPYLNGLRHGCRIWYN